MMSQVMLSVFLVFALVQVNQASPNSLEVTIPTGKVAGQLINFRGTRVYQFLGIPFAEPPVNDLRFKKPVPIKPWEGVKSSTKWPPHCLQSLLPGFNSGYELSEDCLTLNVFSPSSTASGDGKLKPVMVWIHGGGFAYGSAHCDLFNGTVLAGLEDVVIVAINYRLGPLGFLHLPEHGINGNLGLWDQRLALLWVKDNIRYFGGDPNEVTIFGVSAGAMSVSALIVSPQSKGLFKNAILQSGSIYGVNIWSDPNATEKFLEKTDCKLAKNFTICLQSVNSSVFTSLNEMMFWPIYGDEFLPDNAIELIKTNGTSVNILLGVVDNEGAGMLPTLDPVTFNPLNPVNLTLAQAKRIIGKLYGPSSIDYITERFFNKVDINDPNELRLAVGHALGDVALTCPTFMFGVDALKYNKANVFGYFLSQKPSKTYFTIYPESNWVPAAHGDDAPIVFGIPLRDPQYSTEDAILSMIMTNTWGHFARTGETPKLGSQEWMKWKTNESGEIEMFVMELNSKKLGQINNERAESCYQDWPSPIKQMNLNLGLQSGDNNHVEL